MKSIINLIKILFHRNALRKINKMYEQCSLLDLDYWNDFLRIADMSITRFVTNKTYLKFINHNGDTAGFIYLSGLKANSKPGRLPYMFGMLYVVDKYRRYKIGTELIDDMIDYLGGVPDDCIILFPVTYYNRELINLEKKYNLRRKSYKKNGIMYQL